MMIEDSAGGCGVSKLERALCKGILMKSVTTGNISMSRLEQGAAVNLAYSMFGVFLLSMAVYMGACVESLATADGQTVILTSDVSSLEY